MLSFHAILSITWRNHRTANELSAVHSRDLPIRAMDLFHIDIACETGADEFLTFDEDQANLAGAAGLPVWKGKE